MSRKYYIKGLIKKSIKPIKKFNSKIRSISLRNKDFSIISNNCWGGIIYQRYNLKYSSPTIGMYFMADDYIKFLKRIRYYLKQTITFIDIEKSKYYKVLKEQNYNGLIAKIDDIEIMFLHYNDIKEAKEKWERRTKRINWQNLIVKFNDQNLCEYKHLEQFDELEFENKICFTSKGYKNIKSNIFMKEFYGRNFVENDVKKYKKYIKMTEYINNMKIVKK
ncbi:DUF1919 domain-containing protein [Clostridium perfringens]|uniref:DUF1919 domain-containing protein n=1 Tax=Clostridium perfringens TaxID=1502 RepID=UPI000E19BDB7|nr:DUF1919 domain-containing protein [Clostridium perfringens]SUY38508.1 exopolysaccharide biosynthesis protein [Clostridium perfringens]